MNFLYYKDRVKENIFKGDAGRYVGDYVNEARQIIAQMRTEDNKGFNFLLNSAFMPFVLLKSSYSFEYPPNISITASKSGTTVTATGGTPFASLISGAEYIGKYIEWTNGLVDKITSWTSSTVVSVEVSATISSQAGTVTTPKYAGLQENIDFIDTNVSPVATSKVAFVKRQLFDVLYPSVTIGRNPQFYTVKGDRFYVDALPTAVAGSVGAFNVAGQYFATSFYELPHLLVNDANEEYIDRKYGPAIVNKASLYAAEFVMDKDLINLYSAKDSVFMSLLLQQEGGVAEVDDQLR